MSDILIECALHIANTVLREDAAGDARSADRAHVRLHQTIERADNPEAILLGVTRRLGRVRAGKLMIEQEVIDLACGTT